MEIATTGLALTRWGPRKNLNTRKLQDKDWSTAFLGLSSKKPPFKRNLLVKSILICIKTDE
jgi:hypothetical protein